MAMRLGEDWRTCVTVSVIAVLIWVWSATETRQTKTLEDVRIDMGVEGGWSVEPAAVTARLTVDGAGPGLREFEEAARGGLRLQVPTAEGEQALDLRRLVEDTEEARRAGMRVVSVDPRAVGVVVKRAEN